MASEAKRGDWFEAARYGLFIHWGAYSVLGHGEQPLFRDHLDQSEYAQMACAWDPQGFDAAAWAEAAKRGGFRYAVLTARHHDGFCLWDSAYTDYSTAKQGAGRDFVREYVEAFRAAGLKVGLYYSLADWRVPAYWDDPKYDPEGWERFKTYVHNQVEELLTNYGPIDVLWFDGAWPRNARAWESEKLLERIRLLAPQCLVNNRLDAVDPEDGPGIPAPGAVEAAGESRFLGDFGTPEHHITAETGRLWESCQVSTWRLWGYTSGERWRSADYLLDMLIEATQKGGNLLLNVGPDSDGRFPPEFLQRSDAIGAWLQAHGECIYGVGETGEVCEFITYGRQIRRGSNLYLVIRFWDGRETLTLSGLATKVLRATLLTTGQALTVKQTADALTLSPLPQASPTPLFPVICLECDGPPEATPWAKSRLWTGNPRRMTDWARARGTSVWADGRER